MTVILPPKNAKKYICDTCDFKCSKESDWNRHIITAKHQKNANILTDTYITTPKNTIYECKCGKNYIHRQSLYKHQKQCYIHLGKHNDDNVKSTEFHLDKELLVKMLLKNQEVMEKMMEMMEMMPQEKPST
jgi:hypothetical protein